VGQSNREAVRGVVRTVTVLAILAVAIVVVIVTAKSGIGGKADKLYVIVPEAVNVIPGQDIRAAGQNVGNVGALQVYDRGRAARIELDFDSSVWPLRSSSRFALRWGGTVAFSNRYVELTRGASGAPFANGATIPTADFTVPVEFDSVTRIFTPGVRNSLRSLLGSGGAAFKQARAPLGAALGTAPQAVEQASALLQTLQDNQTQLSALVISADRVVNAVDTADPGLGALISGAGTTFNAIAAQATNLQTTISRMTPTLAQVRTTLVRANTTLRSAGRLVGRLSPGVVQLRLIARPLSNILRTVVHVGPDAESTFASLRDATPSLNPLLTKATALMPTVGSIGRQAIHELNCIRPYTPDMVSLFSNWADFLSYSDHKDKFARVLLINIPGAPNTTPYDSATALKLFPGLTYAFPRPPGEAANEPWFLPQCGVGPSSLIAADDPEGHG
jgi:virulence factor Mce-like protein